MVEAAVRRVVWIAAVQVVDADGCPGAAGNQCDVHAVQEESKDVVKRRIDPLVVLFRGKHVLELNDLRPRALEIEFQRARVERGVTGNQRIEVRSPKPRFTPLVLSCVFGLCRQSVNTIADKVSSFHFTDVVF